MNPPNQQNLLVDQGVPNPRLKISGFLILVIFLVIFAPVLGVLLRGYVTEEGKKHPTMSTIEIEGSTFRAINATFYAENNVLRFETTDGRIHWNTKPFLLIEDGKEQHLVIESEKK